MYLNLANAFIYAGRAHSAPNTYEWMVAWNDIELITDTYVPDSDVPYADYLAIRFNMNTWRLSFHQYHMHWKEFWE